MLAYSHSRPLKTKRPRIAPLDPPYSKDAQAALTLLGPPIQLFRVLARRPVLAESIAGWGRYYLGQQSALTIRQRELVIIRTTALCQAAYERDVHVAFFTDKAELTDEQIASLIGGRPTDPCWSRRDRAVLEAVDALRESADLDDATWSTLCATIGEDGALDLLLICGWYHAISFAVNALRLDYDPELDGPTRQ